MTDTSNDEPALRILYEDEALIFIDKPAGIVVQRSHNLEEPVLFELVSDYLRRKGEGAYLLQRLDRGTTGAIFFSKQAELNVRLTRMFELKQIHKRYVALVHGRIDEPIEIDAPLRRVGPISFGVRDDGKRSVTRARPRLSSDAASYIELDLLTGRTHQIRVHMAHAGHPLIGDWLYGERDAPRPMLHSESVELPHPVTRELLRVDSPLPEDFVEEARRRGVPVR
jgi:23S rRNA pseudouridine1911/1915/1917 synthase